MIDGAIGSGSLRSTHSNFVKTRCRQFCRHAIFIRGTLEDQHPGPCKPFTGYHQTAENLTTYLTTFHDNETFNNILVLLPCWGSWTPGST